MNLSDNVVKLEHGELPPGSSCRFVLDEKELYGLDGAVYSNSKPLKIEFVIPDPDVPTYSTGNIDNHVTVIPSTQSNNSSPSLVLPSLAGNPLFGNYYSSSPTTIFPSGTTIQPTANSGYREASVWIVEPAQSVDTWLADKPIHFDVRGRASSNATIKSVDVHVNGQPLDVQRQDSFTSDMLLVCDIQTTGMSGPVLFKFTISDSNGNFAWAEKILRLNAKPVINDAKATLKGTKLSVNALITDDELEKVEVDIKGGSGTKRVYAWKKNGEQTAGSHFLVSFIVPGSPKEYQKGGIKLITVEITSQSGPLGQSQILKWEATGKNIIPVVHEFPWAWSSINKGDYYLKATAVDFSGNSATSETILVHRPEDKEYPKISIITP